MDLETIEFLKVIFVNNHITLHVTPPKELYDTVICKNIRNITNKELLPLKDILEFIHNSVNLKGDEWDCVAMHPDIDLEIIKKYWKNLKFMLLCNNKHIETKILCELLIDLEISKQVCSSTLHIYWDLIFKEGMIDIDIYFKYFSKFKINLEILKNLKLDTTLINEIEKVNILKKFECCKKYEEADVCDAIMNILCGNFKHHNLLIILKKLFKKSMPGIGMSQINSLMMGYYGNIIRKYFNIYEKEHTFIYLLCEFYEFLSEINLGNLKCLNHVIVNELVQKSNILVCDLKYLINKKIITILPSNPIKYKHQANYLFQEYINGNLEGYRPTERGQYTFKQFKTLMCHSNHSKFNGIFHFDDIKFYIYYDNYNNNNKKTLITTHEKFDLHTLNDIYKNNKKLSRDIILHPYIIEIFLYPTIFNNFSMHKSRETFTKLLSEYCPSSLELEFILENVRLHQRDQGLVSINPNLTPYLINKYDSKLDWNVLKFNIVWIMYPHTDFNKLPVFDDDNFWLWATPQEKLKKIEGFSLKFPVTLINDEYIEFENDYFGPSLKSLPIGHFHPFNKCKNNCILCDESPYYMSSPWMRYHHEISNLRLDSRRIENRRKIPFFLPTLKILNSDNGRLYISDFSHITTSSQVFAQ
jgi:hypothetical protein